MEMETESCTETENTRTWIQTQMHTWTWNWALLLSTYIIWLNSPYSLKDCLRQFTAKFPMALSICSASSWCKECHKNLYRHLDCSPNNVLVELERSVWGKQRPLPEVCTVSELVIFQTLCEVSPTFKGSLIWKGMFKISCKSWQLSSREICRMIPQFCQTSLAVHLSYI